MHTVDNITGRLIEVRVATPITVEEIQEFKQKLLGAVSRLRANYVGVVDLRQANVLPGEVADSLIQLLSGAAAQVERTGFLIGGSAVFALQIERILRNSNNPERRAFRDLLDLRQWLGEALTPPEQQRLSRFLEAAVQAAGSPAGC